VEYLRMYLLVDGRLFAIMSRVELRRMRVVAAIAPRMLGHDAGTQTVRTRT